MTVASLVQVDVYRYFGTLMPFRVGATIPLLYAYTIIMTKVGNGLKVRSPLPNKPHQFNIALSFTLQASAGLDAIKVAV